MPCRLARPCTTRWASTVVLLTQTRWRAGPLHRVLLPVSRSVMRVSAPGRVRTWTTTGAPCAMIPRGTRTVTVGCSRRGSGRAVLVAVGRGVAVGAGRAVGVAVARGVRVVAEAATERADALPAASTATTV